MTTKYCPIKGTCKTMCSPTEVHFRIKNNLIHALECSEDKSPNPRLMVKEFSRSAAGCDLLVAEHLRPTGVLETTIDYLLDLFDKMKEKRLDAAYNFVVDRLRAIRQDMVVQQLNAEDSILLLEKMIPFYVETEYICKTRKTNFYDWKLHTTQMEDCFSTWIACLSSEISYSQDILFMSFFRSHTDMRRMLFLLPYFMKDLKSRVLQLFSCYQSGNFVHFFRIFSKLKTILQQSLLEAVYDLRLRAFDIISKGFKARGAVIPVSLIQKWLYFASFEDATFVLSQFFSIENFDLSISTFNNSKLSADVVFVLYKFHTCIS